MPIIQVRKRVVRRIVNQRFHRVDLHHHPRIERANGARSSSNIAPAARERTSENPGRAARIAHVGQIRVMDNTMEALIHDSVAQPASAPG